jgi:hypothetical protein
MAVIGNAVNYVEVDGHFSAMPDVGGKVDPCSIFKDACPKPPPGPDESEKPGTPPNKPSPGGRDKADAGGSGCYSSRSSLFIAPIWTSWKCFMRDRDRFGDWCAANEVLCAALLAGKVRVGRRGGETSATAYGRAQHELLKLRVQLKADGWLANPRIKGSDGKFYIPDVVTPKGFILEFKPNTPSGRRAGERQIRLYETQLQLRGRVIYYDPPPSVRGGR